MTDRGISLLRSATGRSRFLFSGHSLRRYRFSPHHWWNPSKGIQRLSPSFDQAISGCCFLQASGRHCVRARSRGLSSRSCLGSETIEVKAAASFPKKVASRMRGWRESSSTRHSPRILVRRTRMSITRVYPPPLHQGNSPTFGVNIISSLWRLIVSRSLGSGESV